MKNTHPSRLTSPRLRLVALAACVAGAIVLNACTSRPLQEEQETETATQATVPAAAGTDEEIDLLAWGTKGEIRSVDPTHGFDQDTWVLIQAALEPLVKIDPQGKLAPVLANSFEQVDPTTINIVVRDDVTFWNGDPVTVDDVIFSINRHSDPANAAENASYFSNVKSVTPNGENGVEIKLKAAQPEFLSSLALAMIIQESHAVAAGESLGNPEGLIMGTGAYQVVEFAPSVGATLERYDGYWGDAPSVKTLKLRVITDPQSLKLAVQSGEVAGALEIPLADSQAWDSLEGVTTAYAAGTGATFLILDTEQAPFDDIHARRAIAHLVDREGLAKALANGHASPAPSLSSPLLWANLDSAENVNEFISTLPNYEFDVEAASAELSESKTPDGFKLTVQVPKDLVDFQSSVQSVQEAGAEIGIDITLKRVSTGAWLESISGDSKDPMAVLGYNALAATPLTIPLSVVSTNTTPAPWSTYASDSIRDEFDNYLNTVDPAEQLAASKAVVTELSEQLPFVPLLFNDSSFAISEDYAMTDDYSAWNAYGANNWAAAIKVAAN